MKELTDILKQATKGIEAPFFRLNIDGGDAIFRERVYCYELYHQMRKNWPAHSAYLLNGEVDKRAHPILSKRGADKKTPDFLVHTPGDMAGNYAIIEVKRSMVAAGIRKDLITLDTFIRRVNYQRGIYLIYGDVATEEGVEAVKRIVDEFNELSPIELWLHSEVGRPGNHVTTFQRTASS